MSTHRRIGIVCVVCMALALVVCAAVYAMGVSQGKAGGHSMGYESMLFDTSKVHTIDIVMDDWDGFIENCEDEEYVPCAVVVDGESFKNVAIRAKGNTSLTNVKELDSDRYSLKIEFDQYESSTTYHGLDKLSLNNLIQDNTMLKDYLAYRMMGAFGVDSPLASYVYVTVNGEDRGLFLAVEGVEDSFLKRTYGNDTGKLYKPDSMGFGGGRGNGRDFDMQEVLAEQESTGEDAAGDKDSAGAKTGDAAGDEAATGGKATAGDKAGDAGANGFKPDSMPQSFDSSKVAGGPGGGAGGPGGMSSSDVKLQYIDDDPDSYSNIFNNAKTDVTAADKARLIESLRKLSAGEDLENVLNMDEVLRYFVVHDFVCNGDSYTGTMVHNYYLRESDGQLSMIPWDYNLAFGGFSGGDATSLVNSPIDSPVSSGFGGFGRRAQSDGDAAQAQPSDGSDGNATQPSGEASGDATQAQPSAGNMPQPPGGGQMPQMPGGGDMPQMPGGGDMPQMPGDGQVPTSADGATTSSSSSDSRPMVDWIFTDDRYTERYHELYKQFLESVDIQAMIDEAVALIDPYVERDPTKFCTTEEFHDAVDTLKQFCALRSQSVRGQLDGTIPSTEEGQQQDSSALVDASAIEISTMGSMNAGGGGGFGGMKPGNGEQGRGDNAQSDGAEQPNGNGQTNGTARPEGNSQSGGGDSGQSDGNSQAGGGTRRPNGADGTNDARQPDDSQNRPKPSFDMAAQSSSSLVDRLPVIAASVVAMAAGIGVTFVFRRP